MILFELVGSEQHPAYQSLEISNGLRHYDFLQSLVQAASSLNLHFISTQVIKALNFQAIACLHTSVGEYRPCSVVVGNHQPPEHYRVKDLMDHLINEVNRAWENADAVTLACYVLWRMNHIHPFINGNGRTARAICYFVLCLKNGGWLPGKTILPELIRRDRAEYVQALQHADQSAQAGNLDLGPLHALISRLLQEQLASVATP